MTLYNEYDALSQIGKTEFWFGAIGLAITVTTSFSLIFIANKVKKSLLRNSTTLLLGRAQQQIEGLREMIRTDQSVGIAQLHVQLRGTINEARASDNGLSKSAKEYLTKTVQDIGAVEDRFDEKGRVVEALEKQKILKKYRTISDGFMAITVQNKEKI